MMKTKLRIYDGCLLTVDGIDFRVSITPDEDMDPPWENSDACGPMNLRTARHGDYAWKKPYEVYLGRHFDHGHPMSVFYVFDEAVRIGRLEKWNTAPYVWRTKGEQADAAARAMVRYLRGYLAGDWQYVTVTVEPLDDSGDVIPHLSESISGVEYGDSDEMMSYAAEEAESLCRVLIASHNSMFSRSLPLVETVIEPDEEFDDLGIPWDDDFYAEAAA